MEEADRILELLKRGDKRGLELLFQHFYRPLVMYALKFVSRQEEAEDIVQGMLVKFWEQQRFDMITKYLLSYLYQSVHNCCLKWLETNMKMNTASTDLFLEVSDTEMLDEMEWDERFKNIYREIDLLPDRTREIFMAIVIDGKRYKEVANELNISVNTVKTTLSRALSTLRSNLDGYDDLD